MVENYVNLLNELKGIPKNSNLLITTYFFDPVFFEGFVLPTLNDRNVDELNVLVDEISYADTFSSGARSRLGKVGKEYSLQPVFLDNGVFHPKVILAVSDKAIFAWVASANLSLPGYTNNAEFVSIFKIDKNSDSKSIDIVKQLIALFNQISKAGLIKGIKIKYPDWLNIQTPKDRDTWVISNFDTSILGTLKKEIIKEKIKSVKIISPFFSSSTFKTLEKKFEKPKIEVFIQQNTNNIDNDKLRELSKLERISYFEITGFVNKKDGKTTIDEQRRLHGKMMVFEGAKYDYCVSGSANFTNSALEQDSSKGNFEIVVVTRYKKGEFRTNLKDYIKYKKIDVRNIQPTSLKEEKPNLKKSELKLRKAFLDDDGIMQFFLDDYNGEEYVVHISELDIAEKITTGSLSVDFNKYFNKIKKNVCSAKIKINGVESNRVWIETKREYSYGFDEKTDSKIRSALKTLGKDGLIDLFTLEDYSALIFALEELENVKVKSTVGKTRIGKGDRFRRVSSQKKSLFDVLKKLIRRKKQFDKQEKKSDVQRHKPSEKYISLIPKKRSISIDESVLIVLETDMKLDIDSVEYTVEFGHSEPYMEIIETTGAPCLRLIPGESDILKVMVNARNNKGEEYRTFTRIFVYNRPEITVQFLDYLRVSIEKILLEDPEKDLAALFGYLICEFKFILQGLLNEDLEESSSIELIDYTLNLLSGSSHYSWDNISEDEEDEESEELLRRKIIEENILLWALMMWYVASKKAKKQIKIKSSQLLDTIIFDISLISEYVKTPQKIAQGIDEILDSLPQKSKKKVLSLLLASDFGEYVRESFLDLINGRRKETQTEIKFLESKPKRYGYLKPQSYDSHNDRYIYNIRGIPYTLQSKRLLYGASIYGLKWPDNPDELNNFEWYKLTKDEKKTLTHDKELLDEYNALLEVVEKLRTFKFSFSI